MVPQIWSATDWIFCHFGMFLALLPLLPSPPWQPKKSKFEKMKQTPKNIIILHMCTINDNHKMYGSWDMERDRQNFLSFWTVFCPFIPITTWKSKFWINEKTTWRYYHFTHVHHKWRSNNIWFLRYGACEGQNFLSFWAVFYPFTP